MTLENVIIFIINTTIAIIEALLGLRFFLRLLGASEQAPFVQWMYEITQGLLDPFQNMFPSPALGRFFVIEFTTLFAMIVYAVMGFFVVRLTEFVYNQVLVMMEKSKPRHQTHHSSHHEDSPRNHTPLD